MNASDESTQPRRTEITLVTGERRYVEGDAKDIERAILDAARGSIMQLAWLIDADTQDDLAVNPQYVMLLRALGPRQAG